MKIYTCIVCPNGCELHYDEKTGTVTGNHCPRGAKYALSEATHPTRSVTSSVRTTLKEYPVVSVRTSTEIPKELIFPLMKEINKLVVNEYLPMGSIVAKNILNTGADLITTTPLNKGDK